MSTPSTEDSVHTPDWSRLPVRGRDLEPAHWRHAPNAADLQATARVGDDDDIRDPTGGRERLDDRQHPLDLGLVPLEHAIISGNLAWSVQRDGDLPLQTALLGDPGSRNPSYKVDTP